MLSFGAFHAGDRWIGVPELIDWRACENEGRVSIAGVLEEPGERIGFGDDWRVRVVVEEVLDVGGPLVLECLGGRRAAPPEHCGGPLWYEGSWAVLQHPESSDSAGVPEWLPRGFDPGRFDADALNAELGRIG